MSSPASVDGAPAKKSYRLPGIDREGIAQLSLLETALWPLQGGTSPSSTFDARYSFTVSNERCDARVRVYAPLGLEPHDEYVLWGLLGISLSQKNPGSTLLATPYWLIKQLDMAIGGYQYDQLRASLERLALVAYQNTAFYNPVTQEHERVTLHFFSTFLPTRGSSGHVAEDRAWRIEWSPRFYETVQATGGKLLFDLDLYHRLSPASRRLFLKLQDRFWRSNRVFMNVDDLTINGLGYSAARPLKKRKFDLTGCIRELLDANIIELGHGQTKPQDLFFRRGKGLYVVVFYKGEYFRRPMSERTSRRKNAISDDPLYEPLRTLGVDEAGIRRLFEKHARGLIQRWIKITDVALHEKPRGFPGFKVSPASFLVDAVQNNRMPPDWIHAHDKERSRQEWERRRDAADAEETTLRAAYADDRAAALRAYLSTAEGKQFYAAYHAPFLQLFRVTEPERCDAAAHEAAVAKIERDNFQFPEFGVWLLERRPG